MEPGFLRHCVAVVISLAMGARQTVDDFLLERLAPLMSDLRREGLLRSWFFEIGESPRWPGRRCVFLYMRPAKRASRQDIEARFARSLPEQGPEGPAFIRDFPLPDRPAFRERFGGEEGGRLYELFAPWQSRMILEALRAWRQGALACSRLELGLALFLFQLRALGLSRRGAAQGLDSWLGLLVGRRGAQAALSETRRVVERELAGSRRLGPWLDSAYRMRIAAFRFIYRGYAGKFRRVAVLLAAKERRLPSARPRALVILHAYIHVGFLNLGIDNAGERFLGCLVRTWLR